MPSLDSRIAVVIATRNRAALLAGTLAHLAALPEAPGIIVVDNGSTDDSVTVLRGLTEEAAATQGARSTAPNR